MIVDLIVSAVLGLIGLAAVLGFVVFIHKLLWWFINTDEATAVKYSLIAMWLLLSGVIFVCLVK